MFTIIRNYSSKVLSKAKKNAKRDRRTLIPPKNPLLNEIPIFQFPVAQRNDRRVYVWGVGDHGGLGTPVKMHKFKDTLYLPKPSRLFLAEHKEVVDIACGYGFTAFGIKSKEKDIVYGCGINTDSQIGRTLKDREKKIIPLPRAIPLPLKEETGQILGLAAGRAHLLVLTNEGLFTLGNNSYGQCGRPIIQDEEYFKSEVVYHIPDIKGNKVSSVTAGQDHSIALTEKGEVYTFGWGADGQTGLAHYDNEYRPSLVKGDLAGQHIVKVACSSDCVLALSDKGKVYGWGNAEYGQLPTRNGSQQINIATELEFCNNLGHIIDIASGGSFCMVLNNTGEVYVWGFGIIGLGPKADHVERPTLIPSTLFGKNTYDPNVSVSKISCGISHLAAVTNTGELYMWGKNTIGSLGLGHRNDQYFPLKVAIGAQVEKLCCGVDHTVALCKPYI